MVTRWFMIASKLRLLTTKLRRKRPGAVDSDNPQKSRRRRALVLHEDDLPLAAGLEPGVVAARESIGFCHYLLHA